MRAVAPGAQAVVRVRAYSAPKREDRSMASARQATVLVVRPVREAVRILLHDCPLNCHSIHVVTSVGGSASQIESQTPVLRKYYIRSVERALGKCPSGRAG